MISFATFVIALIVITIGFTFFKNKNEKNRPPGPMALPFLGNLLQLGAMPHLKIQDWVKTYGNIFMVHFGPNRVVVISDPKMIKEAFNDANFGGRMNLESFQLLSGGKHGIVNSEGAEWIEQRRFTMRSLRDLGFGKRSTEGLILEEVNDYLTFLKSKEGQDTDVDRRLQVGILNAIWGILSAGNRVQQDDEKFLDIFDRQKEVLEKVAKSLTLFAPNFGKMFPNLTGWNELITLIKDMRDIFRGHVEEHKKSFQDDSTPRDFIDVYLKEIKNTTNKNSSFFKGAGEHSLLAIMGDFFTAGPDTTSSTLTWSILYLCRFPHVQKKVQKEIEAVVGRNRQPTLADRTNLPYCLATLEEVLVNFDYFDNF